MHVTPQLAAYLVAVATAIHTGANLSGLTTECPECGITPGMFDPNGHHITMSVGPAHDLSPKNLAFVVVGCEGYWVINPNEVGIPGHENWMSWEDDTMR